MIICLVIPNTNIILFDDGFTLTIIYEKFRETSLNKYVKSTLLNQPVNKKAYTFPLRPILNSYLIIAEKTFHYLPKQSSHACRLYSESLSSCAIKGRKTQFGLLCLTHFFH